MSGDMPAPEQVERPEFWSLIGEAIERAAAMPAVDDFDPLGLVLKVASDEAIAIGRVR